MIEKDVNLTETLQPLKNCPEEIFRKLFKLTNLLQSVALNKKSSNIFQDKSLLNVEYCALYKIYTWSTSDRTLITTYLHG